MSAIRGRASPRCALGGVVNNQAGALTTPPATGGIEVVDPVWLLDSNHVAFGDTSVFLVDGNQIPFQSAPLQQHHSGFVLDIFIFQDSPTASSDLTVDTSTEDAPFPNGSVLIATVPPGLRTFKGLRIPGSYFTVSLISTDAFNIGTLEMGVYIRDR